MKLNIKVQVRRHYTNTTQEMTLVRTTKTMLILEASDGSQVRLNRVDGTDGLSKRSACYSIPQSALETLLAQIPAEA